jgi:predicted deacylase
VDNKQKDILVIQQLMPIRCASTPMRLLAKLAGAFFFVAVSTGAAAETETWSSLKLLGREIAPGESSRFPFVQDRSFEASYLNAPVFAARGASAGPTLCLTAGIHGDELNGVEVARRAFAETDPKTLNGTLIVLPAINAEGVRTGNRYMSDRRDLNRTFPGTAGGSASSLVSHGVFKEVISRCDALVDLHTASNNRTNLPQIRADLEVPEIRALAEHFGVGIVIGGDGPDGSLRQEAVKAGISAIIYEAGEPFRFQEEEIVRGVAGVRNVLVYLDMIPHSSADVARVRVFEKSKWVRAKRREGGFFFPSAVLGQVVKVGDTLGRVVDPLTDVEHTVTASIAGEIIGMAVSQPVLSGFGLFHIAWNEQQAGD